MAEVGSKRSIGKCKTDENGSEARRQRVEQGRDGTRMGGKGREGKERERERLWSELRRTKEGKQTGKAWRLRHTGRRRH